jgi:hypothetical protein
MSAGPETCSELPHTSDEDYQSQLELARQLQRAIDSFTTKVLCAAATRFVELCSGEGEEQLIKVTALLSEDGTNLLLRFEHKDGHGWGAFKHEWFPREKIRGMVYKGCEQHEAILRENGLNPENQEPSAYIEDVFLECVNTAVSFFQNYRMWLAMGNRNSYDDAVENTKFVSLHSINRVRKLPPDQFLARKKSFIDESSKKAREEAAMLKRKSLKRLSNYLSNSEEELLADRGRPKKQQMDRQRESREQKEKIIKGIRKLLGGDAKKLTKAAIARAGGIAHKGNMTQALTDVLEAYELDLEELIREAKTSE